MGRWSARACLPVSPTFAAERTREQFRAASSAHWDTFEEVIDTEKEDNDGSGDTIDPGDLQEHVRDELEVLATCMDNPENDAPIRGVDASQLEMACLKLAELLKPLSSFRQLEEGLQIQTDILVVLLEARVKLDQRLDVNVYLAVCVISGIMMIDRLRSSEELNVPGPNLSNSEVRTCKQSWTSGKLAALAMRVTSMETLSAQAAPLTWSRQRTKCKSSS